MVSKLTFSYYSLISYCFNLSFLVVLQLATNTVALKAHALHMKSDKEVAEKKLVASQIELEQALVNVTLKESTLVEEKRRWRT